MRILYKTVLIFIICLCTYAILPTNVVNGTPSAVVGLVEAKSPNQKKYSQLQNLIGKILGFLQIVSGMVAVIIIAFNGFNFIIAPTPNIKSDIKDKMLPLLVGIILIFGSVTVTQFMLGAVSTDVGGEKTNGQILQSIRDDLDFSAEEYKSLPSNIQDEINQILRAEVELNLKGDKANRNEINKLREQTDKLKDKINED